MFFKKRYFKFARLSNNTLYLFNVFLNFDNFYFEFLGFFGFYKVCFKYFYFFKKNNFINIFNLKKLFFLKKLTGFVYSYIFNIIKGLTFNYEKILIFRGLGYKVFLRSSYLHFYLSYSHPCIYKIPSDIFIKILNNNNNEISIKSYNKQRLGEVCLIFKRLKKMDVYKGKGVFYKNEKIVLKIFKKK
ncbi:50S ribosomal protein L6 [Candidatus Nasuia deltocephalinicola]|uniref:50S ribosomal protein L6 n=1 Tax=Candidatus Nasuia deltocephalincola TaxID=1160784 RepID=UPI00216AF907|nr:50S ribosomal protein L6 [Candidatus Nasuia deltocephalinicola]